MRVFTGFLFVVLVAKFELINRLSKKTKIIELMEMVRMAKSRPRKNQSERSDLPRDYLAK